MIDTQLMHAYGVDAAVAKYQYHLELLARIDALQEEAQQTGFPLGLQTCRGGNRYEHAYNDAHRYQIRQAAWHRLLTETGATRIMNNEKRREIEKAIHDNNGTYIPKDRQGDLPDFTQENVEGFLLGLVNDAPEMFELSVVEVAKRLSWNYKTNQPHKFQQKMILEREGDYYTSYRLAYTNHVSDLHRVLCQLQGVPAPSAEVSLHRIEAKDWTPAPLTKPETPVLLELKVFKNRNVHLRILNPLHVKEMNRVLAKHFPGCLPAKR